MNDKLYTYMLLRRRFLKRIVLLLLVFCLSFYGTILYFKELKDPELFRLSEIHRCPACYGISLCPEIYSNQIILEPNHWSSIFNAKNIYHGFTKSSRRVIIKKLAHDWELKRFDSMLCKHWKLKRNCKPSHILNATNIKEELVKLVSYNLTHPESKIRKGLIMCPNGSSILDLLKPLHQGKNVADLINFWTMLNLNPEPIVLQSTLKSRGWPVPAYGGVCGRLEVVAYAGETLHSLMNVAFHRRLKFAKGILDAALDFTYKHDRFRFYLLDWGLDNIVADETDKVTFIDLEDVVVIDKHTAPDKLTLKDWYKRHSHENLGTDFSFSIHDMCRHHLSDHNIWAACYILAGDENPLLLPIPKHINRLHPELSQALNGCLASDDRFRAVSRLQMVVKGMLEDEAVVGFGAVR